MSSQKKGKAAQRPKARDVALPLPPKRDRMAEMLSSKNVSQEHIDAAMSMMDPGEFVTGTTNIPARAPWLRSVTTESLAHKLSKADGSVSLSGQFTVEARARPDGALILKSSAGVGESVTPITGILTVPKVQVFGGIATETQISQAVLTQNGVVAGAALGTVAAGGTAWVVPLTSTAGGTRSLIFSDTTLITNIKTIPYTGPLNALVATASASSGVPLNGSSNTVTLTLPANCTHVGFTYLYVQNSDVGKKLQLSISMMVGGASAAVGVEAQEYNLQTLAGINKLRAYRIVGQSLLLTYTGSMLDNGGDIAIARVSSSWTPDVGMSVYDSIMKLPKTRRYSGRVSKGAHCYWCPETVEDFEPKLYGGNYNQIEKPSLKIVAAGTLDDPDESVLLQLETIVEFQSDEPSYASVAYAPPWNSFDIALQLLARSNPCGENPSHLKKIRKFLQKEVKQFIQYGIENPAAIAGVVAKVLPLLL